MSMGRYFLLLLCTSWFKCAYIYWKLCYLQFHRTMSLDRTYFWNSLIHHSEHEVYAGLCVQHPWTVFTLVVIKWKEPKTQQNGKVYAHCHADDCPISIHAPTDWISQQHVFLDVVYAVLSLDACLMCSAVQCYAVDCWKQSTLLEKCCVNMH